MIYNIWKNNNSRLRLRLRNGFCWKFYAIIINKPAITKYYCKNIVKCASKKEKLLILSN